MICEYKIRCFKASILIMAFLISGCATTETSLSFTQSELKVVPVVAYQKLLSSTAMNETVEVKVRSIDGIAVVKGIEGLKYVIVTNQRKQEIRLAIGEITEIKRIREIKRSETFQKLGKSNTTEVVGETLIYAPLIPVAVAMWPALRVSGLDAGKNAEDNRKARLVYEGMSKEDLKTYVGEPKEQYHCEAKGRSDAYEVWVFEKNRVLRSGGALFIDLESEKVYHNSYNTSFFKGDCSLMKQE